MNWRRLIIYGVTILACASLAVGCWNRREPENIAYVLGLGFDYDKKTRLYKAYAQFSNPKGAGAGASNPSQGGKGSPPQAAWTTWAHGTTPYEAIFNLVPLVSRQLSGSHVAIVAISEELARSGIGPVLDIFERERALRITTRPVVVKGDLENLFMADLPLEEITSLGISRELSVARLQRSIVPAKYLTETIDTLAQPGKEPLIPKIEVFETKDQSQGELKEGGHQDRNPSSPMKLAGGAVFRGDKMVGWMNEREIRGWCWVAGRSFRAVLSLQEPEYESGEHITVVIHQASSQLKAVVDGDDIRYELKLLVDGRVEDLTGPLDLLGSPEIIANINRRVAAVIRNDIEMALSRAQALNADVFGLGWLLYRTRYKDWLRVQDRWNEVFPQVSLKLDIRADIRRVGLISRTGTIR